MSTQAIASPRNPLAETGARRHRVGGYNEYAPPPDLADAVEALWTHETVGIRLIHRVVPDAAVSLCFMGTREPDGSAGASRLRLIGPVTASKLFAPPPNHSMAAIRIKLEWCRPLLGVAAWEHTGGEPCYADIRPDLAVPLEAQLMRTTQPADALRLMVAYLRQRRAARLKSAMGLLRVGMESLRSGASAPRVATLARELGVTDRHLRRLIVDETGIAPRHFARIQRFHALLRASDLVPRPAWGPLAANHGYADQSHMIREVQDLAGVTPTQLHQERRAE